MNPFYKLILAVTLTSAMLYVGFILFLRSSGGAGLSIDADSSDGHSLNQLRHTREPDTQRISVDSMTAVDDVASTDDVQTASKTASKTDGSTEQSREAARIDKLRRLGVLQEKRPEPTTALDVRLSVAENCATELAPQNRRISLQFRYDTSTLLGKSLNRLETLVAAYRECGGGEFALAKNPLGSVDAHESLTQMRLDEVKYFFLQHSIPKSDFEFPDPS